MATYNKFEQFVEDVAQGVHNLTPSTGDSLKACLLTNANAPVAGDAIFGDLTSPITAAGSDLDTDSLVINASSGQTAGAYQLVINDLTMTASGGSVGPFQWIVIYNDDQTTPAKPLISYYTYPSEITLQDGETFTLDFGSTFFTIPAS